MESIYKKTGIYRITNTVNGMSYIGKTGVNFGDRWDSHRALLNANKHYNHPLQSDWSTYGSDAFEFRIVEEESDPNALNALEIRHINEYRNAGLSYNVHDGGDSSLLKGKHLSEETKRKIGEKNRLNMIGKKASDETRKKMSASHRARYAKWSEEDRAAWGQFVSSRKKQCHWSDDARERFSLLQRHHPNGAKFTVNDIRNIRTEYANGTKQSDLASRYHTSPAYISSIIHRRRWAYVD